MMIQLTVKQETAVDRARERLEKIRAEELDEDRARMLAVFQFAVLFFIMCAVGSTYLDYKFYKKWGKFLEE